MEGSSGDFTISLSSDVIAEVMGRHFNKEMFKKQVEIVDLKPLADGYQFLLAYVKQVHPLQQAIDDHMYADFAQAAVAESAELQQLMRQAGPVEYTPPSKLSRASNGRFVKKDA